MTKVSRCSSFLLGRKFLLRKENCPPELYNKWRRNYQGPYIVIEQTGPVNYRIKGEKGSKTAVFHVDRLRPCLVPPLARRKGHRVDLKKGNKSAEEIDSNDFVNEPTRRSARLKRRKH